MGKTIDASIPQATIEFTASRAGTMIITFIDEDGHETEQVFEVAAEAKKRDLVADERMLRAIIVADMREVGMRVDESKTTGYLQGQLAEHRRLESERQRRAHADRSRDAWRSK